MSNENIKTVRYVLVTALCWVQYDKYVTSFSNFADLFHEALGD